MSERIVVPKVSSLADRKVAVIPLLLSETREVRYFDESSARNMLPDEGGGTSSAMGKLACSHAASVD